MSVSSAVSNYLDDLSLDLTTNITASIASGLVSMFAGSFLSSMGDPQSTAVSAAVFKKTLAPHTFNDSLKFYKAYKQDQHIDEFIPNYNYNTREWRYNKGFGNDGDLQRIVYKPRTYIGMNPNLQGGGGGDGKKNKKKKK